MTTQLTKTNHFRPPRKHNVPEKPALPHFFLHHSHRKKSALTTQRAVSPNSVMPALAAQPALTLSRPPNIPESDCP